MEELFKSNWPSDRLKIVNPEKKNFYSAWRHERVTENKQKLGENQTPMKGISLYKWVFIQLPPWGLLPSLEDAGQGNISKKKVRFCWSDKAEHGVCCFQSS